MQNFTIALLGLLGILPSAALASCPSGQYSPMTPTQFAITPSRPDYAAAVSKLHDKQVLINQWAARFFVKVGIQYNRAERYNNSKLLFLTVKEKYPDFFIKYKRKEDAITRELLLYMKRYGAPTLHALNGKLQFQFLAMATWSVDAPMLRSIIKELEPACKSRHSLRCAALPGIIDRAQFIEAGTQKFGTIPHVRLDSPRSLAELNALRQKYNPSLPPIKSISCVQ